MDPEPGAGPSQGRRLMARVGATLFLLLILVYWGIGLNFTFAYALLNEAQRQQTLVNYLWELPAIGIPLGVLVPLWLLRPIARDYDAMRRGESLPDPAKSSERLLRFPKRMVWYFTPLSIGAYLLGGLQAYYLTNEPFDEFLKGIPLGLPLGLLISISAYLAVVHFLDPVRRLFVERHGYGVVPRPMTSIYRKVVISTFTIVSLSLALLWLVAYAQGQVMLEDQLHTRMQETALPSAVAVASYPNDPLFQRKLDSVALGDRGYVFLVDDGGNVESDHPGGAQDLGAEGWDEAQRAAVLAGPGRFTDRTGEVRLVAFAPLTGTGDRVVMVTYRDDFAAPLAAMTWSMLAVTALAMGLALALTLLGARAITRPIRELTRAMEHAPEGGGSGTPLITDDEVGALARTYDGLIRRLQEKTHALEGSVERLEGMDAMKTRFINIASHELRTPMTPIRTELHLLRAGKRGPLTPEQEKGLQMVDRNVDRLNRLVRELLEASRMQAGQLRLSQSPMDLGPALASALATMEGPARAKGVALEGEVLDGIRVYADEDRTVQVLINLLENAIQFTPEGGSVRVASHVDGALAVVDVIDTGAGIDPALIPRLFQPFSQAEPGVPRTEGGTGLGLFICKSIVEAQGGMIACESDGRGRGARFRFTIPLYRSLTGPPVVQGDGERPSAWLT